MEWFSQKISMAGIQIPNWGIVLGALIAILLIYNSMHWSRSSFKTGQDYFAALCNRIMLAAIRRASSSELILSADPIQASFSEPASPDSL
jgi:hypothetical protein